MNDQLIRGLVGLRAVIGVGAFLAPRLTGRLFGLDVDGNPQAPYLARLFGIRDVALAYGASSTDGPQRAQWLQVGLACDLGDAVAGVLAGRGGELPTPTAILVTGTALSAAALGVAALQGSEPTPGV
ncbi:MAG TPA: hypothetical protein VMU90_08915 [Solirubrobacteraceae bacterium]|nr:hypothetical protein [Solirubrobacteraceae bacterium]